MVEATQFETQGDSASTWFALRTAPRHEKRVAARLTDHLLEVFLPLTKVARQWSKRRPVDLEIPLFSGYLFVRLDQRRRPLVLGTPGVTAIVGNRREPLPIPDPEMSALRAGLHLYAPEPHSLLAVGDRVEINAGPLAGMQGILIRKKSSLRVVITVTAIMRSVSIEIDAAYLTPTPNSSSRRAIHKPAFTAGVTREWEPSDIAPARQPAVLVPRSEDRSRVFP